MAKKVIGSIKLQVKGGQANPSPPIGPALGQHGVNIAEFCKAFNARTQDQLGTVIPVVITIFADRSFSFITKTPPASVLLKQAAKIAKGSGEPNREKVGSVTRQQVGRGGIIRDPLIHAEVLGRFINWAVEQGFRLKGLIASPILGSEGNREFLALLSGVGGKEYN